MAEREKIVFTNWGMLELSQPVLATAGNPREVNVQDHLIPRKEVDMGTCGRCAAVKNCYNWRLNPEILLVGCDDYLIGMS